MADTILSHALDTYPREAILLLRGKEERDEILIDEIVVPPLATHGVGFSTFPGHMLPTDLRVMGVSHSRPSGNLKPSVQDLNHFYGRIMVIAAYPFQSYSDTAVYDKDGSRLRWQPISDRQPDLDWFCSPLILCLCTKPPPRTNLIKTMGDSSNRDAS